MVLFDTNAILRYVLQDNEEMADAVEREILSQTCLIPIEVVAEITYVLNKVYKINRGVIAETVQGVLELKNVSTSDDDVVFAATVIYASTNLDFVDCLMAGYAKVRGYTVFTFDKNLKKIL